jgi:uncharacterized oligopeptide transporter (OPT) family protein
MSDEPQVKDDDQIGAADPDQAARDWLANVYQGDDARQLSVRSIVTGMIIGGVMSISNLYVGLKTGWGLGVTITACIIAYAVFKALETIIPAYRRNPFTILENYTMSSAASAAGYMSSAGLVSAIPALYLATDPHRELAWWELMSWLSAVSFLGVFMAIPLKRQLINIDQLPFPSGIATAETLKSMHTSGAEALDKARSLFWGGIIGAILGFWREAVPPLGSWWGERSENKELGEKISGLAFPEEFPIFPGAGSMLERFTIGFEGSLIMVAAGAIMGIRVGVSLFVGALIYYGVIGQWLVAHEIAKPGYRGIVSWTLWPATAMMVTSGLLSFALKWKTVLRAFRGLAGLFGKRSDSEDPLEHVEVPGSWFVVGTLVSGLACVLLGHLFFQITWWMGVLAVLMTFLLSIVAARATGETDITPIGAMGKITQLMYAVVARGNIQTNLMTASITAGAASHSADLLTDLKSGYLLGGNPRKQTISQLFGVVAGTLVCVPVYLVIADPTKLGSKELPAPAAKVWEGVARILAQGIDKLPPYALQAMAVGGLVGIFITLAEEFVPQKHRRWIPSATGLGIAGVVPAFNSISMFIGALGAWLLAKASPAKDEKYTIPVSSGLIAGETLMGVAIKLYIAAPGLVSQLWSQLQNLGGAK